MEFLYKNVLLMTLLATIFTFFITTLGSSLVFFFKKINKNVLDIMLGISAGIMIAASFFSLLNPAINLANNLNMSTWLVLFIGFILGVVFVFITEIIFNKKIANNKERISVKRCIMLFISITIHNIPEGMAIGVAFASTLYNIEGATIEAAILLALGIGIQNFPEGCAISLPLRREKFTRFKAFLFGSLSGIIEIIAGILGALLVLKIRIILPFLLSFAASAMLYVVVEDLIPESQTNNNKSLITIFTLIGFSIMMILDISLG